MFQALAKALGFSTPTDGKQGQSPRKPCQDKRNRAINEVQSLVYAIEMTKSDPESQMIIRQKLQILLNQLWPEPSAPISGVPSPQSVQALLDAEWEKAFKQANPPQERV